MAEAAGHKFGQIIGNFCEASLGKVLQDFADQHGLYLDKKGKRPARTGQDVRWENQYGFCNNLDYVLERGGTPQRFGVPVAFIECAWRRYKKHSVNKAAEITGAVCPIVRRNRFSAPMYGCLLVGDYSPQPRKQLEHAGFTVAYMEYRTVIEAFRICGIDAYYDDKTQESVYVDNKEKWNNLSDRQRQKVWEKLVELNRKDMGRLMSDLERAVKRLITEILVLPLYGRSLGFATVAEAIAALRVHRERAAKAPLVRYEVHIRYSNDSKVIARFNDREDTIKFLNGFESGEWTPVTGILNECGE